jgi:minor extracellular serine protease Vpr
VYRATILAGLTAALVSVATASAGLQPVRRIDGAHTIPRVRTGTVQIPDRAAEGQARVIVTLHLPPLLAADLPQSRGLYLAGRTRKLNIASAEAKAYLARVDAAQRRAVAVLRRAIPDASVSRRFQLVLDGLTVSLQTRELPKLFRLGFVRKVYPSLTYTRSLNRSTSIIGAPELAALTGARGDGVKIAIVDDGVDQRNPFFNPDGFQYPAGFPKGQQAYTTPKVIVARTFPGTGSGPKGRLPVDRTFSFHGTAVAGVAAGDAGTTAPATSTEVDSEGAGGIRCKQAEGGCHPKVVGLSGVAPRAWIGNYRVFTVPNPLTPPLAPYDCCTANTPEIAAAFEAAVKDGMDVINFSGGGAESDPASDALVEAVANVAKGGVVPVMAAGNDRDLFGLGSAGSPGTAPDAISAAAVENRHVFSPALTVLSPSGAGPQPLPFVEVGAVPDAWATNAQRLVDVGTITGTNGKPVDRFLCAPSGDPNDSRSSALPQGSLNGSVALISRGNCTFDSKVTRARGAGAIGIIFVDNRAGEANAIAPNNIPAGMIADLDGARLRDAMAGNGGRATILMGHDVQEIDTHRNGSTPTSFSSAGLTDFGHLLKPDVAAPGAAIISSTLVEFAGAQFAYLDGTSFASPHIAGAAALLVERHPSWSPKQVKSALMSTARAAFDDTADTREAPVYLEGAGLAWLPTADDPKIFTDPQSLSFQDLNVNGGAASRAISVTISDAGGGAGAWSVELQPQVSSAGAAVDAAPVTLAPGGQATLQVVAHAPADAAAGDDFGFVVLRNGGVTRRIPYGFSVTRPQLAGAQPVQLRARQSGTTAEGPNRASVYRWPTAPFSVIGVFGLDKPVAEDGSEKVYYIDIAKTAVNVGVAVADPAPSLGAPIETLLNAPIHPWLLGSLDENNVQGYAGTPVNINGFLQDYIFTTGVAGTTFARPGRYYVSVDSGRDPFTGRSLAGSYVLRSWVNDIKPPRVQLITTRVAAGRPSIAFRATDRQSGVDPLALTIGYQRFLFGASFFDPATGVAVFPFPHDPDTRLKPGRAVMRLVAADYQESKNVYTVSKRLMPNTTFVRARISVVNGPTIAWLTPNSGACVSGRAQLAVLASDTKAISSVGFFAGGRQIGRVRENSAGIYSLAWQPGSARGRKVLTAVVSDTAGREARAKRVARLCK